MKRLARLRQGALHPADGIFLTAFGYLVVTAATLGLTEATHLVSGLRVPNMVCHAVALAYVAWASLGVRRSWNRVKLLF